MCGLHEGLDGVLKVGRVDVRGHDLAGAVVLDGVRVHRPEPGGDPGIRQALPQVASRARAAGSASAACPKARQAVHHPAEKSTMTGRPAAPARTRAASSASGVRTAAT